MATVNSKARRRKFLDDLCAELGIDPDDGRRSEAARAHRAFGDEQCRAWLAQADGDYNKWNELADLTKALEFGKRRSKAEEARLEKARHTEKVTPTVVPREPQCELVKLREQLEDELSKGSRANHFLLAGLRERIAELSAETGTPKI